MTDQIFFDGKKYISAADAGSFGGFTRDYVARLCRDGKVIGRRVGKNWYADEASFKAFLVNQEYLKSVRSESLSKKRSEEYHRDSAAPHEPLSRPAPVPAPVQVARVAKVAAPIAASAIAAPLVAAAAVDGIAPRTNDIRERMSQALAKHTETSLAGARSLASTPAGISHAALQAAHVPAYALTPMMEFAHKLIALTLTATLVVGTYAAVDPQYARIALGEMRDQAIAAVDSYHVATGGGFGALADRTQNSIAIAAEHPQVAAAGAASYLAGIPSFAENLASAFNSGVDKLVYAIAFPSSLIGSRGLAANSSGGSVSVSVSAYAQPRPVSSALATSLAPAKTAAASSGGTRTVIERIVSSAPSLAQSGGITEALLNAKLNQLDNKLSAQMFSLSSGASTVAAQNYAVTAQTNAIGRLVDVAVQNATITGGSISGATIEAKDLSVDGLTALHNTSIGGSLDIQATTGQSDDVLHVTDSSGAVIFGLSPDGTLTTNSASSTSLVSSILITGDATATALYVQDFVAANSASTSNLLAGNATSTNFFSTFAHIATGVIDNFTATFVGIDGLTVNNSTTTNATTTNLAVIGNTQLATTSVQGDLTLSGSLNFTGSSSTINATGGTFGNASTTNFVATNATSTNLFATNASTTNATSTNFFAVLGHLTSGIIDSLTATFANINGLTVVNSTTTNATTTNSYISNLSASTASSTDLFSQNFTLNSGSANTLLYLNASRQAASAAVNGSLTFSAGSLGLNLANANTFTGLQQFANASSTQFSVTQKAYFGTTGQSSFDAGGALTLGTPLSQGSGGTGFSSYNPGDILYADNIGNIARLPIGAPGNVLQVQAGLPAWGAGASGGGGGGGNGLFATSTDSLVMYPIDTSRVLVLGGTATTSLNSIFEVHGIQYISSKLGIASSSPVAPLSVEGNAYVNGNLGLGINPTVRLDVAGAARINPTTAIGSYDEGLRINSASDGYALLELGGTGTTGTGTGQWQLFADPNNAFEFRSNGTMVGAFLPGGSFGVGPISNSPTTLTGAYFAVDAATGNVGIGNAAPSYQLDATGAGHFTSFVDAANFVATSSGATSLFNGNLQVNGTTNLTGRISSTNASTSLFSVFTKAYFGGTATSTFDPAGNLALVSNGLSVGTNQLVVSGGNIGIGTTTPTGLLALQANSGTNYPGNLVFNIASSTASATTTLFSISNTGTVLIGNGASARLQIGGTSSSFPSIRSNGNQLFVEKADGSTYADLNAANIYSTANFVSGADGIFSWTSANGTPQGTKDTGLSHLSAGVVGFGTGAQGSTAGGFIAASSTIVGNFTTTGTGTFGALTNTGLLSSTNASTSLFSVFNTAYFGGTATTTIDNAGNVVIPSTATLTYGGVTLANAVTGTGSMVLSISPSFSGNPRIPNIIGSTGTNGVVDIKGTTSASPNSSAGVTFSYGPVAALLALRIAGDTGNIGVGTSTPTGKFAIQLNAADAAYPGNLAFNIASSTASATTTLFAVTNTGNVGIGTNAPTTLLHVLQGGTPFVPSASVVALFQGNTAVGSNAQVDILSGSTGGGFLNFGRSSSENAGQISYSQSTNAFNFRTNGSAGRMTIDSSGHVGIAQTSPTYQFDVTGEGHFTSYLDAANFVATSSSATSLFNGNLQVNGTTNLAGRLSLTQASTTFLSVFSTAYFGGTATTTIDTAGNILGTGTLSMGTSTLTNLIVTNTSTSTFAGGISVAGNLNFNGALLQNNLPFVGSQWTTSGSNISYSTGNVGIGIATPWARLHVVGNSATTGNALEIGNSASTTILTVSNAGVVNIGSNQGTSIQTNIFSVDASSSTTTISNLSIGNINFDTDAGMVALASLPLSAGPAAGTIESQSILIGDSPVLVAYGENDGTDNLAQNTRVAIGTSTIPYARLSLAGAGTGTGQLFEAFNSASTTVFRLLDNGTGYLSGSFGIGTTSPWKMLSVAGDIIGTNITATGTLSVAGATTFTGLSSFTNASTSLFSVFNTAYFGGTATTTIDSGGNISLPSTAQILAAVGSATAPGYSFASDPGVGIFENTTGVLDFCTGGTNPCRERIRGSQLQLGSAVQLGWASTAAVGTMDTTLTRKAAANVQLGATDAAAAVAQTLSVQSVIAGTSDTAGSNFTIAGSQGTGLGAGGSILFKTAPAAGTTGTAQNALVTALSINSAGLVTTTNASTSLFSVFNKAYFGGTATTTIDSTGAITVTSGSANTFPYASSTALTVSGIGYFASFGGAAVSSLTANYLPKWNTGTWANSLIIDNGTNIGAGTSTPYSRFSIWGNSATTGNIFEAVNSASTSVFTITNAGVINVGGSQGTGIATNIFSIDSSSSATTISNLALGNLIFDTDAGNVTLSDIPVDSSAALGVQQSQAINIGGNPILTASGISNGAGGVTNLGVLIGTSSVPYALLHLVGSDTSASTAAFLIANSASSTLFSVNDAGTSYFGGNVGIGTTSPWKMLSVAGDIIGTNITATGTLSVAGATTFTGLSSFSNASTSLFSVFNTAYFGGTATTTIDSAGNVTVPTNAQFLAPSGSATIPGFSFAGTTNAGLFLSGSTINFTAAGVGRIGISGSGIASFISAGFNNTNTTGASVTAPNMIPDRADSTTGFAAGSQGNLNAIVGGVELMRWATNSVGIGTSTPTGLLALQANNLTNYAGNLLFNIASSTASATTTLFSVSNTGAVTQGGGATSTFSNGINLTAGCFSVAGVCITAGGGGGVSLSVANTWTALQTFSAGASTTQLSVFGKAYFGGTATTTIDSAGNILGTGTLSMGTSTLTNLIVTNSSTSTFAGGISVAGNLNFNGALLQNNLPFVGSQWTTSGSNISYSTGNVGVGTTTPWGNLAVSSAAQQSGSIPLLNVASTTNAGIFSVFGSGVVQVGPGTGALLGTNEQIVNNQNGAAGIALHNSSAGNETALFAGANGDGSVGSISNNDFKILTNNKEAARFTAGGNFGIGTTTPTGKFAINLNSTDAAYPGNLAFNIASSTASATTTLFSISNTGAINLSSGAPLLWSTDTGFSRISAGVIGFGTGTTGSTAGGFLAASSTIIGNFTVTGTQRLSALATPAGAFLAVDTTGNIIATTTPAGGGGGGSGTVGSGTQGQFAFYNAAGTALTATSSIFLGTTGNIGVGTTTPWGKLAVSTASQQSGDIPLFNVASTTNANIFGIYGNGNVGIGTTSPKASLSIDKTNSSAANSTDNIDQFLKYTGSGGTHFGNSLYLVNAPGSANTLVGSMLKLVDSTSLVNTVRGLEVQADDGTNTQGENTAVSAFAHTFGVRAVTDGDAGGVFVPAGLYAETRGTVQGNAIRAYSGTITSANALVSLLQDTSSFTSTGLLANFANGSGSFTGKFVDLQLNGVSKFNIKSDGTTYFAGNVGIGTTTPLSTLTVLGSGCFGGTSGVTVLCGTTGGNLYYRAANTGNYDVAELYATDDATLLPGEIVSLDSSGTTTVKRASGESRVLGVVSTAPGLILGGADSAAASTTVPVALSGRVPVIVSLEGGPIGVGDELALSSSTPGVAMKASDGDSTIGYALEPYITGGATSTIEVFVSRGVFATSLTSFTQQLGTVATSSQTTLVSSFLSGLFAQLTNWYASSTNGIADFFAGTVHTQKLCVGDNAGETCVTKAQLDALLAGAAEAAPQGNSGSSTPSDSNSSGNSSSSSSSSDATSSPDTEKPVISVSGANPATLTVGDTYNDLGATVSDNVDGDLGIKAAVDGAALADLSQITIDTSAPGTHTIRYSATDNAGNTGTASRTVNVVAAQVQTPDASSSNSEIGATSDPTSSPQASP